MTEYTCSYCNKSFSNKSNLTHHIGTAKYCMKLRNTTKDKLECKECEKKFTTKFSLDRHITVCEKIIKKQEEELRIKEIEELKKQYTMEIFKKDNIIEEMKKDHKEQLALKDEHIKELLVQKDNHIKELESKLENIALKAVTKSSTTNITQHNNRIDTINNLIPLTDEHIKEQVEFFTLEHIKQGPSGFSQYALDYPLKNRIACTDFARRKLKYKNADGQIVTDLNMNVLSKKLFTALQSKNKMLSYQYAQELQDFILNETINVREDMDEKEAETFTMKNERFVDVITDIYSQVRQVNEISEGKKTELLEHFLKEFCSKITV
jgi:hypothetical protein